MPRLSFDRHPIFDTVRSILGRGFSQGEVQQLDRAIDSAARPDCPEPSDNVSKVSAKGITLIKHFEGCARLRPDGLVEAYPDPGTGGAPWTIGWGATGPGIAMGTVWTREQCEARLQADIARHAKDVTRAIGNTPTTQEQFDALVSFHFNTGAIARATLTRRHKAGDFAGAAREFARWNKAGGRVLAGLVSRRSAEARLYRSR